MRVEEKCRIAVMVSGGGTNLQAILDAGESGIIKSGRVVIVISDKKKCYALKRAEMAGISTYSYETEKDLIEKLEEEKVDLIALAGFLKILSPEFCKRFEGRIVNVHPSLIPAFCGKGAYGIHVHEKALAYGVKVTGATVHYVNEEPDGGRIIAQKPVEVLEGDTPESLQKRVMKEAEHIIYPKAIEEICRNLSQGMKNNE